MRIIPIVLLTTLCSWAGLATAADRVVFHLGFFTKAVSLSEFQDFVGGSPSKGMLKRIIKEGEFTEDVMRDLLGREHPMDVVETSKMLSRTERGQQILDIASSSVTTPSRSYSQIAMRSAITRAAADDGEVSVLEIIEAYPTDLYVDLKTLIPMIDALLEKVFE